MTHTVSLKKSAWQKINGAAFYKMGELITAVFITGTQKKKAWDVKMAWLNLRV